MIAQKLVLFCPVIPCSCDYNTLYLWTHFIYVLWQ